MRYEIFSVYDNAVGVFGRPMFMRSQGEAVRVFTDEVNRAADDNMLNKHPNDYTLYSVGEWNDDDSALLGFSPPLKLVQASAVLRPIT